MVFNPQAQAQYLAWEKETMKGLKNDVASLSYYSSLTNTVSASYEDLRKTVETKEYTDYIPDAWAGLIKVSNYIYVVHCVLLHIHINIELTFSSRD